MAFVYLWKKALILKWITIYFIDTLLILQNLCERFSQIIYDSPTNLEWLVIVPKTLQNVDKFEYTLLITSRFSSSNCGSSPVKTFENKWKLQMHI